MVGQGTTSYTVASIMNRLYLQYLTPPDDQDILVSLAVAIDDTILTISLGPFQIPEDEALLRQGAIIECDQELMRVVSYSSTTAVVTVLRGQYGTEKVSHLIDTLMVLNPPYPRSAVYEAVADNVRLLSPKIYTTSQEYCVEIEDRAYVVQDDLAISVISILSPDGTHTFEPAGQIVEFHPTTDSRTFVSPYSWGDVWLRFRRKMGTVAAETDTLEDLGVDPRWVNIIIAGAAADLLVGRELSATHTEWVQASLEAERIEPGKRVSIAGSLRQYRNTLLRDAAQELDNEFGISMDIAAPLTQHQNAYGQSNAGVRW